MHATFGPKCNMGNMLDLYAMQKNMNACNSLKLGLTCNKNKLLDLIAMQNKHESMQQFKFRTNMQ